MQLPGKRLRSFLTVKRSFTKRLVWAFKFCRFVNDVHYVVHQSTLSRSAPMASPSPPPSPPLMSIGEMLPALGEAAMISFCDRTGLDPATLGHSPALPLTSIITRSSYDRDPRSQTSTCASWSPRLRC